MSFGDRRPRKRNRKNRNISTSSSSSSSSASSSSPTSPLRSHKKRVRLSVGQTSRTGDNTSLAQTDTCDDSTSEIIDGAGVKISEIKDTLLDEHNSHGDEQTAWVCRLPVELLSAIFAHVASMCGGAVPALTRVSRVCRQWRHVAARGELWTHVDLSRVHVASRTGAKLQRLLVAERLQHVQHLNLDGWGGVITDRLLSQLCRSCRQLRSLSLAGCHKLSGQQLRQLPSACSQLQQLCVDRLAERTARAELISGVADFCRQMAPRLTGISLAVNVIVSLRSLFNIIAEHCVNLQLLDLSNVRVRAGCPVSLDFTALQRGCRRLRVLRLANAALSVRPCSSALPAPGFAELRELSLAQSDTTAAAGSYSVVGNSLRQLLHASCRLQLLDIRGCRQLSAADLATSCPTGIQQLFVSGCERLLRDSDWPRLVAAWSCSLSHLDVAGCVHDPHVLADVVSALTSLDVPRSPLRWLDVSSSAVSVAMVMRVIESCHDLEVIDLTSCRLLPRGVKRRHENIVELKKALLRSQTPAIL